MHPKVGLESGHFQIDVKVTNPCIEAVIDIAEPLVEPLDILNWCKHASCLLPILAGTYGKPQLKTDFWKTEKSEFSNCQVSGKRIMMII